MTHSFATPNIRKQTVACRGCLMPGDNEVLGCPRLFLNKFLTNIFYSSRKISQTFLLVVHQNVSNSSPKISDDLFLVICLKFSLFRISFQISQKFAPSCPPSAAPCLGINIFLFFLVIYTLFYENWLLICPPRWMPGAVAPSAPPLHATTDIWMLFD